MDRPIERSEDPKRGDMPHLRGVITEMRRGLSGLSCARCRADAVTHLIDTRSGQPRAVCRRCAGEWAALTPLARAQARQAWVTR